MSDSELSGAQLIFTGTNQGEPDPAAVGAIAHSVVGNLRAAGEKVSPVYTGEKGSAEIFLWVLAASTIAQGLIALPELALKVAQLLNELKKLRDAETPTPEEAPSPQPLILVLQLGSEKVTLRSDTAPVNVKLLTDLLAEQLPAHLNPTELTAEIQVPPTPPNEI